MEETGTLLLLRIHLPRLWDIPPETLSTSNGSVEGRVIRWAETVVGGNRAPWLHAVMWLNLGWYSNTVQPCEVIISPLSYRCTKGTLQTGTYVES